MRLARRLAICVAICCGSLGASAATAADHSVLVVRIAYRGEDYVLRDARVLESPVPLRVRPALHAAFRYALLDAAGRALVVDASPDPRVLRAPLSPPGETPAGHVEARQDAGEFVLRLPYRLEGRALRLERAVPGQSKPAVQVFALPAALGR